MTYSKGGNGSFRGGRDFDRPQMFDAVCAKCGDNCQVPFRPNGSKDVFCSKCFESVDKSNSSFQRTPRNDFRSFRDARDSRGSRDFGNSRGYDEKPMFRAICDKCGDHCQVPFEPRNGKPVLCSSCFENDRNSSASRFEPRNERNFTPVKNNSIDLDSINSKLDRIIELLTSGKKESKPAKERDSAEMTAKIKEEIDNTINANFVKADKKVKKTKIIKE